MQKFSFFHVVCSHEQLEDPHAQRRSTASSWKRHNPSIHDASKQRPVDSLFRLFPSVSPADKHNTSDFTVRR